MGQSLLPTPSKTRRTERPAYLSGTIAAHRAATIRTSRCAPTIGRRCPSHHLHPGPGHRLPRAIGNIVKVPTDFSPTSHRANGPGSPFQRPLQCQRVHSTALQLLPTGSIAQCQRAISLMCRSAVGIGMRFPPSRRQTPLQFFPHPSRGARNSWLQRGRKWKVLRYSTCCETKRRGHVSSLH